MSQLNRSKIYAKLSAKLSFCVTNKQKEDYDYVSYNRVDLDEFQSAAGPITPEISPLTIKRQRTLRKQSGRVNLNKYQANTQIKSSIDNTIIHDTRESADFTSYFNENEITMLNKVSFQHNYIVSYASTSPVSQGSVESQEDFSLNEDWTSSSVEMSLSLYTCCRGYMARLQGDLSLDVNDRVELLIKTDQYSLVKCLRTGDCGYVANDCILPV